MNLRIGKALALLLAGLLAFSCLPAGALAETAAEPPLTEERTEGTDGEALEAPEETEAAEEEGTEDQPPAEEAPPPAEEEAPLLYTITYVNFDDEVFYVLQMEAGQRIDMPVFSPMREGYTFLYWYDTGLEVPEGVAPEEIPFAFESPAQGDLVLRAFYAPIPVEEVETPAKEPPVDEETGGEEETDGPPAEDNVVGEREELLGDQLVLIVDNPGGEEDSTGEPQEGESQEGEPQEGEPQEGEPQEGEPQEGESLEGESLEEQTPLAGPSMEGCVVNVYSSHSDCMEEGETIQLWAELVGFEGMDVVLQWQYSSDGSNWIDVAGADGLTHSFVADSDSVNYYWRLAVRVLSPEI